MLRHCMRRARRSRFILPVIARSCVALTAIIVAGGTLALGVSAAVQPNIVFILADDLDRATTAVQPAVMPNLMQLVAKAGADFSRAYVQVPLCAPSRAAFMSGLLPHRTPVR